jgi:hypothetical protein
MDSGRQKVVRSFTFPEPPARGSLIEGTLRPETQLLNREDLGRKNGRTMELYAPGARVAHVEYGDGTVTRADEFHTVVDFDAHGVRMFSSPRVVLRSSAVPAPIKVVKRKRAVRATAK